MKILKFGGETTVEAIANKAYSGLTSKTRKQAVSALLQANPGLTTPEKLVPGTVITIPTLPGLPTKPVRGPESPPDEIRDLLVEALRNYGKKLEERHTAYQADLSAQQSLSKDKSLTRAISTSETAVALLKQAAAAIAADSKAAAADLKRVEAAIEKLASDLSAR